MTALLCANYPAVDPERIPYMPWPIVSGLLARLSMIEFRRHAHTAQLAYITAATMGGAKDGQMMDYVLSFARLEGADKPGQIKLRLKGGQADDFRTALSLGLVSQRLLNYYVDS